MDRALENYLYNLYYRLDDKQERLEFRRENLKIKNPERLEKKKNELTLHILKLGRLKKTVWQVMHCKTIGEIKKVS